jgi:hypothetical protein
MKNLIIKVKKVEVFDNMGHSYNEFFVPLTPEFAFKEKDEKSQQNINQQRLQRQGQRVNYGMSSTSMFDVVTNNSVVLPVRAFLTVETIGTMASFIPLKEKGNGKSAISEIVFDYDFSDGFSFSKMKTEILAAFEKEFGKGNVEWVV